MSGLKVQSVMERSARSVWFWMVRVVFAAAAAKAELSYLNSTMGVSAPHLYYSCPKGATARLACALNVTGGTHLKHHWLFTPHSDQHCKAGMMPRNISHFLHHNNHIQQLGLKFGYSKDDMWVTLLNITHADEGRYCCLLLDINKQHNHGSALKFHSHIVLQVTQSKNGSQNCTIWAPSPPAGSVPVALALTACILALLSLPVILVLVYKQRQNTRSRRAQELVKMDSEDQGHDNPVFLGGSPPVKTRTVSQIMTRQSSGTGHHLLSDPGTPLSPDHGDVFFPSEDPIPESPDLLQI
ncbi:V-type immunoglobulin domain-containing suppressor of T-cell activation [Nematolebias whitei]|uniref:V-type immunoglobulin domain-containing suppressor of T-cell activation n=1 Tax=Nematolebias whitei TaxID=451745 RepID=UPI00189C1B7D|nr:V-type immunoglobulin domain-containing suppressor of T-cell activation [Nematolebias whitei]